MAYVKKSITCKEANAFNSVFPTAIHQEDPYIVVGVSFEKKGVPVFQGNEQQVREFISRSNYFNNHLVKARK